MHFEKAYTKENVKNRQILVFIINNLDQTLMQTLIIFRSSKLKGTLLIFWIIFSSCKYVLCCWRQGEWNFHINFSNYFCGLNIYGFKSEQMKIKGYLLTRVTFGDALKEKRWFRGNENICWDVMCKILTDYCNLCQEFYAFNLEIPILTDLSSF